MNVIFNGKLIDNKDAVIHISDKGYFFDFAVYSTLKVLRGQIFFPEYHIDRLFESAELIGLKHKFNKKDILGWINLLVNSIRDNQKNILIRMILIGDAEKNENPKLYVFPVAGVTFYPDKLYRQGCKVITYRGERHLPHAKTKDLLMSFLALGKAKEAGALDALLIDHEGIIREGTRTNFYAIKGRTIYTAPEARVVGGVARKILLKAARGKIEIKEEDIAFAELKEYDEFFVTSTSMNVMPVSLIDETKVSGEMKKTKEIAKLFKEYYHGKVSGGAREIDILPQI